MPWKNHLDFQTAPTDTRVVVAMSGGVDSSVAAALLVSEGYDVVGITLQLYDQGQMLQKKGACCAGQDIYDARQVAEKMGFPHYILNYESRFSQAVVDQFADAYLRGETPVPCIQCNQQVKFKDLLLTAQELGATALVTGHYVQRIVQNGKAQLHAAQDLKKDQSYFLFGMTQDQLNYLRFPLGGLEKTQTRAYAAHFGLPVCEKPDSQDICFVPNGSYTRLVEKLRPGSLESGEIVHLDGRVLGHHQGIIHYTIGQRKGLGISAPEPLFVIRLNPETHQVIVGPREALACREVFLKDVNWLGEEDPALLPPQEVMLKIRSAQDPIPAILTLEPHKTARLRLHTPEYGIAPGQAGVFYAHTRLLGGGWITAALQSL